MSRWRRLIPVALATAGVLALAAPSHGQGVAGVVVDVDGRPIAGVTANALMSDAAVTGSDGRFELKEPSMTVRFIADGYRPVTRPTDTLRTNPTIVLERASAAPTLLPVCPPHLSQPGLGDLRVPRFPGSKYSRGEDIDYVVEGWRVKGAWLRHGWGPLWSGGLPNADGLAALTRVEERDLRRSGDADLLAAAVADLRGTRPDGGRYRFVGEMGETFEYDNATPEAAAHFDRMLDAMCRVPPQPPGPAKR